MFYTLIASQIAGILNSAIALAEIDSFEILDGTFLIQDGRMKSFCKFNLWKIIWIVFEGA